MTVEFADTDDNIHQNNHYLPVWAVVVLLDEVAAEAAEVPGTG